MLDRLNAALADRYTVERELGRGGMASVWLARDRASRPRRRHQGAASRAGRRDRRGPVRSRDPAHRQASASQHRSRARLRRVPGARRRLRSLVRHGVRPRRVAARPARARAPAAGRRCAAHRRGRRGRAAGGAPRRHRAPRHQAGESAAGRGPRVRRGLRHRQGADRNRRRATDQHRTRHRHARPT